MLPWVCSVIDHRGRHNVVKTSVAHEPQASVSLMVTVAWYTISFCKHSPSNGHSQVFLKFCLLYHKRA